MIKLELIGRSSSHFTRVPRIFAHELGLELEVEPVGDLVSVDRDRFAGNPALKIPTLRRGGSLVFGAENICRTLVESSSAKLRVVWPEELRSDVSRNAQELVWHAMAAQVQLVVGTVVGKLPADNLYFTKGRAGFEGALQWLDEHLDEALAALPTQRDLSLFETTLYCLFDHLSFRPTVPTAPYARIAEFARLFGARSSALATQFRFDPPGVTRPASTQQPS